MSAPLPIPAHHHRARSASESSDSSSGSPPPQTPPRPTYATLPRISAPGATAGAPGTSPTSPILSFLSGQSPMKSPAAYPFTRAAFSSAIDDEDAAEPPVARHARRASAGGANSRFAAPAIPTPAQQERGAGVLRRLSLGGAFARPQVAPPAPTAVPVKARTPPPIAEERAPRTKRRSATLNVERPRRAPSPMGERILKGHFDGFN